MLMVAVIALALLVAMAAVISGLILASHRSQQKH